MSSVFCRMSAELERTASSSVVMRADACAKTGCGQQPTTLLSFPHGVIDAVAVDEHDVYFVLADNLSSSPAWRVVKAPLDGSSTPIAITSNQFGGLMEIAIDATRVYWVRGGTEIVATPK